MADVVSLRDEKDRKKRADHAKAVLQCWDDFEHKDRQAQRELAAEVHQKNRENL